MSHNAKSLQQNNEKSRLLRVFAVVLLSVLLAAAVFGAVFAALRDTTAKVENLLDPASVTCSVDEEFDGTEKKKVTVKNTGDVAAYIRVKVVINWTDKDGKVIMYVPDDYKYVVGSVNTAEWTRLGGTGTGTGTGTDPGTVDITDGYWYYNGIVNPGKFTSALVDSIKAQTPAEKAKYNMNVYILAEAIQAVPNQVDSTGNPVSVEKWGVTFDGSSWS